MGKVERSKKRKGREINDRSKSGVQEQLEEASPHFMHYVGVSLTFCPLKIGTCV